MHFITSQTEEEQVAEITQFFRDNLRDSVKDQRSAVLAKFESSLDSLEEEQDYFGLVDSFLSLRQDLTSLPTTHNKSALTIQRAVLLILPLFKILEERGKQKDKLREIVISLCQLVEESDYNLAVKVNS